MFFFAGVINTAGKLWKDQRKFLHDGLRHFGMSYIGSRKAQMENRIMREVEEFLSVLAAQKGNPIDLNPFLAVSLSNVICDILMSVRFSHNDERFRRFMFLIEEGFKLFSSLEASFFIPILKYLPGQRQTREKIAKVSDFAIRIEFEIKSAFFVESGRNGSIPPRNYRRTQEKLRPVAFARFVRHLPL